MSSATKLRAENVKRSGSDRLDPEIRDHAWHHIHLGPELGHIEVMQYINRAEQDLDRLADGEMQVRVFDDNVVLPIRIIAVQAHGVVGTDVADIGRAQPTILARQAEAPLPLLAHDLDLGGVCRNRHELVPNEKAWRQHGRDAYPGADSEPPFEPFVFGVIGGLPSLLVVKAEDAISHEHDDRGENKPGDPERDVDCVVDVAPVGGDRRPPPRAQEVKHHRADRDQEQYERYSHPTASVPVASPIQTVATSRLNGCTFRPLTSLEPGLIECGTRRGWRQ